MFLAASFFLKVQSKIGVHIIHWHTLCTGKYENNNDDDNVMVRMIIITLIFIISNSVSVDFARHNILLYVLIEETTNQPKAQQII